ncbi:hypothetical protein [Microbacterium maritypicum]|uniref:hypothetical protein n=1 Tax=Microbacterium maritypicum TaxID=33918 RepID=UPI0037F491E1
MNIGNVVKSFFLGLGIGLVVLVLTSDAGTIGLRLLSVLASGGIGMLVGLVTEWLTSLLPIRLARPRTYFLINGAIAVIVTAVIMLTLMAFSGWRGAGMWRLIVVVLAIVMVANIVDYLLYRRTMARLRRLQARLGRAADER